METFTFDFCVPRTAAYPAGETFQMGKGHEFSVKPLSPIQRSFIIEVTGMKWFANSSNVFVSSISPTHNILKFTEFYEAHQTWKRFIYPHPIYGNLTVRFKEPFSPPKAIKGGSGWVEPFEVVMIEQP